MDFILLRHFFTGDVFLGSSFIIIINIGDRNFHQEKNQKNQMNKCYRLLACLLWASSLLSAFHTHTHTHTQTLLLHKSWTLIDSRWAPLKRIKKFFIHSFFFPFFRAFLQVMNTDSVFQFWIHFTIGCFFWIPYL